MARTQGSSDGASLGMCTGLFLLNKTLINDASNRSIRFRHIKKEYKETKDKAAYRSAIRAMYSKRPMPSTLRREMRITKSQAQYLLSVIDWRDSGDEQKTDSLPE